MAFRRLGIGLAAAMVIFLDPSAAFAQDPEAPSEPEPQWQEAPSPEPEPEREPKPEPKPQPAKPDKPQAPAPPAAAPYPYPYGYPGFWKPPEDPMRTDPLLPVGITFLCIGAVAGVAGALLFVGAEEGDPVCSQFGGCIERPDHGRQIAGGGFIGVGVGMAAVAIPALIQGVGKKPREGYRRSHGMTAAGSVFANIGGGIFGAGAGSMIADSTRGSLDAGTAEVALMGVGGALLVLGGVLWGMGAERVEGETVAREGAW